MKSRHLTLRLPQFSGGRKALADGLTVDLARQTEVWAMAWLVGLMAMAVRLSTTAMNRGDGPTAKITEFQDPRLDGGTLVFEGSERVRHESPFRTYAYVRIITPKKESRLKLPF